ncbi:DEAD/DEAH box helicase [Winogradskyella tangerina]|uniref:DEAD/DEAH box helicase n=1 Tax=Winogradskyella tangerina TaxID=2023240 RepID=UPI000DBE3469|nr:DEAD/DEAH box helicase [Winogradskyella tangerina]
MTISIDVNIDKNLFLLNGEIDFITGNRRLLLRFRRLGYEIVGDTIQIPFRKETQVKTLNELKRILSKFQFEVSLKENTTQELASYQREEEQFDIFSKNAKKIRNDEFHDNPELVSQFDEFQSVLKKELKRTLYPLQLLSSFHMAFSQNSCNFAVPGAGKTSIVYGAYAYLKSLPPTNPKHVDKLLVIGPLSSFAPWENEYEECFGVLPTSFRMSGNAEISRELKKQHLYSGNPDELTLIFHGGVPNFESQIIDFLKKNKTLVVVDEAHRIKNHEGVWGKSVTEISKEAVARVILTGTPVPNGYQDIYNLYKFIYPFKFKEILGVHYHNLEDMTQNSEPESERVQNLKENLSPYFIRIKKDDLGLPEIKEELVSLEMNKYQREIYDFIEAKYIPDFKENSSATVKDTLNKAKLIRLRQASTNPALLNKPLKDALESGEYYYDPNSEFTTDTDVIVNDSEFFKKICDYQFKETPAKFIAIKNLIEQKIIAQKEKVIIWTIFIQNAKDLKKYLHSINIESKLLIGEIGQVEREATIQKFNDPKNQDFQVVIANPFSVAESISLHKGCHNAIYMERDYNCSNFLQSKDRIHRVGLPDGQITNYYYFVSRDSIDEVINHRLNLKIRRMEEIINDDIPLFARINDTDETDIIKDLIANYAKRS